MFSILVKKFDASEIVNAGFNHQVKNSLFEKLCRYFWLIKSSARHGWNMGKSFHCSVHGTVQQRLWKATMMPGQWHHHCYFNFRLTKILLKIALFTQGFQNGARTRKSFIRFPLNHLQAKEQEETRAFDLHSSSTTEAVGTQMLSPRSILNCAFLPQTDDSLLLR